MASLLQTLRAGPPPPKVTLLPDGLFFARPVPVAAGATPAEAAAQAELALEAVSPFPLAQLYYGHFWTPGAESALVFAAYRRRFPTDTTAAWGEAEMVLPAFATLLGAKVQPATTVVLASAEGLTAIHWAAAIVPARVIFRSFPPPPAEDTEDAAAKLASDRARLREELIRACDGSRHVIDLEAPPAADPSHSDREVVFRSGDCVSHLPAGVAAALDVRDRGELAAVRGARRRDVVLWRVALGCAAAFGLLLAGEVALQGGRQWQRVREGKQRLQLPIVERIKAADEGARRIADLATKRLLPVEMLLAIGRERMPREITFTRAFTKPGSIYTLMVEAKTTNIGKIDLYKTALRQLPVCESVESIEERTRGDTATFTLVVTFKPDALKPLLPPS